MKRAVLFLLCGCFAFSASAVTLHTTDGRTLQDVTILNTNSGGVLIQQNTPTQLITRQIPYSILTPESYQQVVSTAPVAQGGRTGSLILAIRNHFPVILRMEQNIAKLYPNPTANQFGWNMAPALPNFLPSIPTYITFDAIAAYGNGTVGWADSNPGFNNVSYGRIYIAGLNLYGGDPWTGKIYPTSQTITYYNWIVPVFALTAQDAILISGY